MSSPNNTSKPSGIAHQRKILVPGFLELTREVNDQAKLRVNWRNALLLLLALAVFGWVAFFSAAYIHLKYRRNYEEASYLKTLALPFVWESYQQDRGQFYIDRGFQLIQKGEVHDSLNYFRGGLSKKPSHLKARLTLSEIFDLIYERPDLAVSLLQDGFKFLDGISDLERYEYVEATAICASRNKYDNAVIEIVTNYAKHYPLDPDLVEDLRLAYMLAVAYRNAGDTANSSEIIDVFQLHRTASGLILTSQIMWDQGQENQAIQLLIENLTNYEENHLIYEKLISYYRQKNLSQQEKQICSRYLLNFEDDYYPYICYLTYLYENEPHLLAETKHILDNFLRKFSDNRLALKHMANLCAKYGDTENTINIFNTYQNSGHELEELLIAFTIIESKLRGGNYAEALADLESIENSYEDGFNWDETSIIYSIKAATYFGLDNPTYMRMNLDKLLESPHFRIERYFSVADFFMSVGAPELSLEIMERCMETRASNPDVVQSFIEIHLRSNDGDKLAQSTTEALQERRLPNHLLKDAYLKLASDENLFLKDRTTILEQIESKFDGSYLFKKQTRF